MVETFPIYHIHYMTLFRSVNDAIVCAENQNKAKSLLEDYLQEHPLNPKYPEMSSPETRGFKSTLILDCRADKEGVIYDSQVHSKNY